MANAQADVDTISAKQNEMPADSAAAKHTVANKKADSVKYDMPRRIVGIRGGMNISSLKYTHDPISRYSQYGHRGNLFGLFMQLPLGHSAWSLRPEVSLSQRGDSLSWLDVNYAITSHYVDLRLPITWNLRMGKGNISPYLMAAPVFSLARGGTISYSADDYTNPTDQTKRIKIPIREANINSLDFSIMLGGGIDFTICTDMMPVYVSLEGGYNFGLVNNFAQREEFGNENNPSTIQNPFFGSELWHKERYNRGLEVALRVGLPLDNEFLKRYRARRMMQPDTVKLLEYQTDTIVDRQTDTVFIKTVSRAKPSGYTTKECFTIAELYTLLDQGADITGKRICMFDIKFDFDSYKIRPESEQPLNELVRMMWDYPQMTIEVYGHTDSIGTPEYNQRLSENRAKAVVEYISNHGVSPSRIKSFGYGLRYPIDTNSTEEGRFRNRRVEFDVITIGIKRKYNE